MSKTLPEKWQLREAESIYERLRIPVVFDKTSVKPTGKYKVIDQSADGHIGFIDEEIFPCDKEHPITTFANHTCAVRKMIHPFGVIQNVFPLRPKPDIDAHYLYQILRDAIPQTAYKGHYPELRDTQFLIPPLKEQQKIAEILTSVDEVIENTQSQINKLEDLKKATMNELLTKGIGHTEFKDTEIGRIPKVWRVANFESLVTFSALGTVERGNSETSVPLVKMGNLQSGVVTDPTEFVSKSKLTEENYVSKGDFLFNTRNTPELVGKVANYNLNYQSAYDNNLLKINFNETVSSWYMGLLFNQSCLINRLKRLVAGTTSVAAIYWSDLRKLKISVPKTEEQSLIVSVLHSIQSRLDDSNESIRKFRYLKQSLMQDLLTGKVRVSVN